MPKFLLYFLTNISYYTTIYRNIYTYKQTYINTYIYIYVFTRVHITRLRGKMEEVDEGEERTSKAVEEEEGEELETV